MKPTIRANLSYSVLEKSSTSLPESVLQTISKPPPVPDQNTDTKPSESSTIPDFIPAGVFAFGPDRRKKTNVACIHCIQAKVGCDMLRPCRRCVRLDRVTPPINKRKHQSTLREKSEWLLSVRAGHKPTSAINAGVGTIGSTQENRNSNDIQTQSCSSSSPVTHTVVKREVNIPPQPSTTAFRCEYCSQKFNLKHNLIQHTVETHADITFPAKYQPDLQTRQCDICDKIFNEWSALNKHQTLCCYNRVFNGNICEKTFKMKGDLNTHMCVHNDELPFSCEICKKSFKYKQSLNNHMLVHSGERWFSCEICQKEFKTKN
eukprot:195624_1